MTLSRAQVVKGAPSAPVPVSVPVSVSVSESPPQTWGQLLILGLLRLAALIPMTLAVLAEGVFTWSIATSRTLFLPAWVWHVIAPVLLLAGVLIFRRRRQVQVLHELPSIHQEQSVPSPRDAGAPEEMASIVEEMSDPWVPLALPVGFFLPFFGVPGLALLTVFSRLSSDSSQEVVRLYRDYIRYQVENRRRFGAIDVDEAVRQKLDLEPVVDLLASPRKNLVWGSIEVLSRMSDEFAIAMIRKTMARPDMDVKFYSSWGLERMEQRFLKRIEQLQREFSAEPSPTTINGLAGETLRYLRSGLVEPQLVSGVLGSLVEDLRTIDRKEPGNPFVVAFLGLFQVITGDRADGLERLRDLVDAGELPPELFPDVAEAFFAVRDFARVRELIAHFTLSPENERYLLGRSVETTLTDLREFWSEAMP